MLPHQQWQCFCALSQNIRATSLFSRTSFNLPNYCLDMVALTVYLHLFHLPTCFCIYLPLPWWLAIYPSCQSIVQADSGQQAKQLFSHPVHFFQDQFSKNNPTSVDSVQGFGFKAEGSFSQRLKAVTFLFFKVNMCSFVPIPFFKGSLSLSNPFFSKVLFFCPNPFFQRFSCPNPFFQRFSSLLSMVATWPLPFFKGFVACLRKSLKIYWRWSSW